MLWEVTIKKAFVVAGWVSVAVWWQIGTFMLWSFEPILPINLPISELSFQILN